MTQAINKIIHLLVKVDFYLGMDNGFMQACVSICAAFIVSYILSSLVLKYEKYIF